VRLPGCETRVHRRVSSCAARCVYCGPRLVFAKAKLITVRTFHRAWRALCGTLHQEVLPATETLCRIAHAEHSRRPRLLFESQLGVRREEGTAAMWAAVMTSTGPSVLLVDNRY